MSELPATDPTQSRINIKPLKTLFKICRFNVEKSYLFKDGKRMVLAEKPKHDLNNLSCQNEAYRKML